MNQSKDAETEEGKVKSSLIRNFVGSPHHPAHKHTHVLGLQTKEWRCVQVSKAWDERDQHR